MLVAITVLAKLRISISTDGSGCLQMGSLDLVSMENNNLSARSMSLDNNCLFMVYSVSLQTWAVQLLLGSCTV